MQKIKFEIICIGKIKSKELTNLINDYTKRLRKYGECKIIELPEKQANNIEQIIKLESKQIIDFIDEKSCLILLDRCGKELSSEELANYIEKTTFNYSKISFIIGGSWGVSQELKDLVNLKLSFSKLTFPHQLFRLMLVEQIYRSMSILNNTPYHK